MAIGSSLLVRDTFTRADSTTGLGSTEASGTTLGAKPYLEVWQSGAPGGHSWGVTSNTAYQYNGTGGYDGAALVYTGASDVEVRFTLTTLATYAAGIVLRYASEAEYIIVRGNSSNSTVYVETSNGSISSRTTLASAVGCASGDTFRVTADGTAINVYRNGSGTPLITTTTSHALNGRAQGIAAASSSNAVGPRLDGFEVYGTPLTLSGAGAAYIAAFAPAAAAFWPMDDAAGDIADVVGLKSGTSIGAGNTYRQTGPHADVYSVAMDGTSSTAFRVLDNDLWSSSAFTVDGWVLASTLADMVPFAKTFDVSDHTEWYAVLNSNGTYQGALQNTGNTPWKLTTASAAVTANTWHHVAVRTDGTTCTCFVDAVPYATSSGAGARVGNGAYSMTIGRYAHTSATLAMIGKMCLVGFNNSALSDADIALRSNFFSVYDMPALDTRTGGTADLMGAKLREKFGKGNADSFNKWMHDYVLAAGYTPSQVHEFLLAWVTTNIGAPAKTNTGDLLQTYWANVPL